MKSQPKERTTLLRQWHMLLSIPRYPRKTTTRDIRERLAAQHFETTTRTVQRDLLELAGAFPLVYDDRSKPYGWSWSKDAPAFQLPSLSVAEAMTLQMVQEHLKGLLPDSTLKVLEPYFRAAADRMAAVTGRRRHDWLDMVRTVPPTQQLLPPKIEPAVQAVVYEALLEKRQLRLHYVRRGETRPVEYEISPLAVVQRGPVTYIVATLFKYRDIRLLALHRIKSAVQLDQNISVLSTFNLDEYIRKGHLSFGTGKTIKVKLRFHDSAGDHLYETPLSEDQVIEDRGSGTLDVAATVQLTPQLQWWLLGFGSAVEIRGPQSLRATLDARKQRAKTRVPLQRSQRVTGSPLVVNT